VSGREVVVCSSGAEGADGIRLDALTSLIPGYDADAIRSETQSLLLKLSGLRLSSGRTYHDALKLDPLDLYWFQRPQLVFTLDRFVRAVQAFDEMLGPTVKEVNALGDWTMEFGVLESMCGAKSIDFTHAGKRSKPGASLVSSITKSVRDAPRRKWAKRVSQSFSPSKGGKARRVLFLGNPADWGDVLDAKTGKVKRGDLMLDPIFREMEARGGYEPVLVDFPMPLDVQSRVMDERIECDDYPSYLAFETLEDGRSMKAAKGSLRRFETVWKDIVDDSRVHGPTYKGVPFVRPVLEELGYPSAAHAAFRYYHAFSGFFAGNNADAVVMTNEASVFCRACIVAGKLNGVPSLAIQHGLITPTAYAYSHQPGEWGADRSGLGRHLATATALYGPEFRDILLANGYGEDALFLTGQPRYDELANADAIFDRDAFAAELGLDPSRPMLAVTTQTHAMEPAEAERLLRATFKLAVDVPEMQVVVKPHPNEPTGLHRRLVAEMGAGITLADKGLVTPRLLHACDALLTVYSTTALEALILDRPVVIIDLWGGGASNPYIQSGAVIGVTDEAELAGAVERALKGGLTESERSARQSFVHSLAYKVDGKASERVVDLIGRLCLDGRKG